MKRYLIFMGLDYYPSGGWNDFVEAVDTLEAARYIWEHRAHSDWWQVVDTTTMELVDR